MAQSVEEQLDKLKKSLNTLLGIAVLDILNEKDPAIQGEKALILVSGKGPDPNDWEVIESLAKDHRLKVAKAAVEARTQQGSPSQESTGDFSDPKSVIEGVQDLTNQFTAIQGVVQKVATAAGAQPSDMSEIMTTLGNISNEVSGLKTTVDNLQQANQGP